MRVIMRELYTIDEFSSRLNKALISLVMQQS